MGDNLVRYVVAASVTALAWLAPLSATSQSVLGDVARHTRVETMHVTVRVKSVPLKSALEQIAQQAGLAPYYGDAVAKYPARVSLDVRDLPASEAFERVLQGTGFWASITPGKVVFRESPTEGGVASGSLSGTVVDATTKRPLTGATVTVVGTSRSVSPTENGTFRITDLASGSYTVTVRCVGYTKLTRTVAIGDGQIVTLQVALEPSVSVLDQMVVTGTVVATAQREVPNAMTVITAKDIERRGITRIDQLFRGDVPGLFAMNQGSSSTYDAVIMFSRGATALSQSSAGTWQGTNPIKTYVDGVELADPRYLSQIDPKSIERIEIVSGPQASTIYGSNAINGVMQVFTKRGSGGGRPQLTASLQGGWVENNFSAARTPQHDDAVQVNGVEGHWSYNAGGSWSYMGPWTPGSQTARLSGFGGARIQRGIVTVDGTLRIASTTARVRGGLNQADTERRERGWYGPAAGNGLDAPGWRSLAGQTLGLSLGVTSTSWWSHEFGLGTDQSFTESRGTTPRYVTPVGGDTMLSLSQATTNRQSVRYASTMQIPLASFARTVLTVGADGWQSLNSSTSVRTTALTGTLNSTSTILTRRSGHNSGGFAQAKMELWDQLFVTYGLRAEWNPNYGDEAQPNVAPRYGVSYARDNDTPFGPVTVKLRASYGRVTRPPYVGAKTARTITETKGEGFADRYISYYGNFDEILASPDLGPEHQQGGEGGIELYLGNRGSLVVTRYNQTVDGLIDLPLVDSVRSIDPSVQPSSGYRTSCDAAGYCYISQYQNLNVASIRNQGWELQGAMNVGPFITRGTYSWTKSRVLGITPRFRSFFTPINYPQYQPGASFKFLPEHTWAANIAYAQGRSMIALALSGTGMLRNNGNKQFDDMLASNIRLSINRARMNTTNYAYLNAGYVMADLNASRRFSSSVEGILQVQNLGDIYRNDYQASYATLGRQTKLGLRLRL